MHCDLARQLEVMHTALQIVTRGAQVAQFLRFHHLIVFRSGLHFGFFGRDIRGVEVFQLFLTRRDVKRQFIVELQRLVIEQIKRLDVLEQRVLVLEKIISDLVDLGLHLFELRREFGKGRRAT